MFIGSNLTRTAMICSPWSAVKESFSYYFHLSKQAWKNFTFSLAFLAESRVKLNRINVHQLNRDGSSTQHFFLLFQYFFNHPKKWFSLAERDFLKLFFHIRIADMNRNCLMLCSRTLTRFFSKHRRESIDHTIVFARHETCYPSSGNMTMRTDRRGWGKMICIKRLAEEKAGEKKISRILLWLKYSRATRPINRTPKTELTRKSI